jgi:tRNA nucleotidyltransferase/poly(A) polymerase
VAHRDDLGKMAEMGLEGLAIASIAITETSPLLHSERAKLNTAVDYSRKLSAFFPVYFVAALYELQSLIQRFNIKAYVIGGITRDLLLFNEKRLQVEDVDITVEGDAIALASFLMENSRNFKLEEQYPEFGTAKVRYKDSLMFDFASTRQEVYPACGTLPVVVNRGVPLVSDIIRRDFTVNALAFSLHELGKVLDYSNGIRDIQKQELRVLHPVSFFEDPSRILRALKFCARFNFKLAEETRQLLENFLYAASPSLQFTQHYKGGGDRIKQELKSFLGVEESPVKSRWVRFFLETGCYRLLDMESAYQPDAHTLARMAAIGDILPEIGAALSQYVDQDFRFDTYLCLLCRDMEPADFQHLSQRLGLTRNEREFAEQFRKLKDAIPTRFGALHEFSSPAEIFDIFRGLHLITVTACLVELGLDQRKRMKTLLEAFLKYKRKWEKMRLELDGNDLMKLGAPEGKLIGQLLDQLLHAKLAGQTSDRLGEVQFIQARLAEIEREREAQAAALEVTPNLMEGATPEPADAMDSALIQGGRDVQ